MYKLRDEWQYAEADLGIKVFGPRDVEISDRLIIRAEMLIPDFGNRKGTMVVQDYSVVAPYIDEIRASGYFASSLDQGRDSMMDVLRDWRWYGAPEKRPTWL